MYYVLQFAFNYSKFTKVELRIFFYSSLKSVKFRKQIRRIYFGFPKFYLIVYCDCRNERLKWNFVAKKLWISEVKIFEKSLYQNSFSFKPVPGNVVVDSENVNTLYILSYISTSKMFRFCPIIPCKHPINVSQTASNS